MSQRDAHISQLDLQPMRLTIGGERRIFDILDPQLPDWLKHTTLPSGNYPHKKRLKMGVYEETLENLQEELVKLQAWLQETGERIVILFEGRDAAGKGGTISALRRYLNPRWARNVALSKPTETERHQWYYQRYVVHFPTAGEIVTFDRSWYNRAGVEPVMGFCTPEQHAKFLDDTPHFERMINDEGIRLFKIWLNVGREMQLKRFHDRVHSRLKYWKFSSIDVAGIHKWDSYTQHRDTMLEHTHSSHAPWIIVRSNDKRRARIAVVRRVLRSIDYKGRNLSAIGNEDPLVIGEGTEFFDP